MQIENPHKIIKQSNLENGNEWYIENRDQKWGVSNTKNRNGLISNTAIIKTYGFVINQ